MLEQASLSPCLNYHLQPVLWLLAFGALVTGAYAQPIAPSDTSVVLTSAQFSLVSSNLEQLRESVARLDAVPAEAENPITQERKRIGLLRKYLSEAEKLAVGDLSDLTSPEHAFFLKVRDDAIESFGDPWHANVATDRSGRKLATYQGWVFLKPNTSTHYSKLLPGSFPQWYAPIAGSDDTIPTDHFYVFLPTARNEQDTELWLANGRDGFVSKICTIVGEINSSPVISEDGMTFAHVVLPKTRSQGDSYEVSCFTRPSLGSQANRFEPVNQFLLYETRTYRISRLKWVGKDSIQALTTTDAEPAKDLWITIPVPSSSVRRN